jgi:hypothetical protein
MNPDASVPTHTVSLGRDWRGVEIIATIRETESYHRCMAKLARLLLRFSDEIRAKKAEQAAEDPLPRPALPAGVPTQVPEAL